MGPTPNWHLLLPSRTSPPSELVSLNLSLRELDY